MRKRKKRKWHEIYVICDGSGWVKIGIAVDAAQRLIDVQIGNPRLLSLVATAPVIATRAHSIERAAHFLLRHCRWFKTTHDVAIAAIVHAGKDWHRYLRKQPSFTRIARYGEKAYIDVWLSEQRL